MADQLGSDREYSFVQKVWITGGIFSLLIALLLLFQSIFGVLILILAGSLIAIFFRGLSEFIGKKTGWNSKLTMTISVAGTLLFFAGLGWLIGAETQSQLNQLSNTLNSP